MGRFLSILAVIAVIGAPLCAQVDSTMKDDDGEQGPRRKPLGEWLLGITYGTFEQTVPLLAWNGYDYVQLGDTTVSDSRTYFSLGYGGHVPLFNLGKYSTVWLVPAAYMAVSFSNLSSDVSDPSINIDLSVPVHVTAGYGGLRRKAQAWGIEGGLGVTASRRFTEGVFTVVPSALVDVTYAPKNVFRLRFMTDLISYEIAPTDKAPYTMRTWSLMFVVGL
jgi:hypothetical protein